MSVVFLFSDSHTQFAVYQTLPIPDNGFENETDLIEWAGRSSFGGGRVELVEDNVYCVVRSITSGRASSEVIVFVKKMDHIVQRSLFQPDTTNVKFWQTTVF